MHSLGQTEAHTLQPPVRKCTQNSGSMRGAFGTACRKGTEIAALGPERDLGMDDLAVARLLHPGCARWGQSAAHAPHRMHASESTSNGVVTKRSMPREAKTDRLRADDLVAHADAQTA